MSFKPLLIASTLTLVGLSPAAQALSLDELKKDGPHAITAQTIPAAGFGRGTIYSPNTPGKYALVAVCPGFVSPESSVAAISKRLATHGFVVVTIGTKTLLDFPSSRASQLLAALKAASAVTTGPAAGKIDATRQVAAGWSMGGGGALEVAAATPGLKAVVAYAPWNSSSAKYTSIVVPAAIIGATADVIAPAPSHSEPFYKAIPATTPKLLGVIQDASHFFPNKASEPASYTNIAWVKRFADGDARYGVFLSGQDAAWATFVSNGPF